jgi:aminopeptidase-like protein
MKSVLFIGVLNFSFLFTSSQSKENESKDKLMKIVYTLSADSMLGRAAGSLGEGKAKKYLMEYFKHTGLTALNGSYIQSFTFSKDSVTNDSASNIVGLIDNKKDSTIIIGAHYDHIGFGGPKSRSFTHNKIHNGADDNASGVAVMLILAEQLNKSTKKKYNYLFIAFSAHENGLYGSKDFITKKTFNLNKVKLMLNLDMVGRLDIINPILKVIKKDENNYLDTLLNKVTNRQFKVTITADNIDRTDAAVFTQNKVSAISITTGIHDDYHKTTDDADKINYNGMYLIMEYLKNIISAL